MTNKSKHLSTVGSLIALFALTGICSCTHTPTKSISADQRIVLSRAKEQFLTGNYPRAIMLFEQFLAGSPPMQEAGEAHYYKGLAQLATGQLQRAQSSFELVLDLKPPVYLKALAQKALADTHFARQEYAKAQALYDQILRDGCENIPADDVLYKLGVALQRQQRWDEARAHFGKLTAGYPTSRWASSARRKLASEDRFFSVQIAALERRQAAEELLQNLSSLGYQGFLKQTANSKTEQVLFAVRVGKYDTYQKAVFEAQILRRLGYDAMVIP